MQETIDVTELPVAAREAFARAVHERRTPIAQPATGGGAYRLLAALAVLGVIALWGFGSYDEMAWQGAAFIPVYVLGCAGVAAAIALHGRRETLRDLLGCEPGVYVLGTQLVDARRRKLRIYKLLATEPETTHHYYNGRETGCVLSWHGFDFAYRDEAGPYQVLAAINSHLSVLRVAAAARNFARVLELDPIALGLVTRQRAAVPPASTRWVGVIATVCVAVALWNVRNVASREEGFLHIDSARAADAWIASGGDRARGEHKAMEVELAHAASYLRNDAAALRRSLARYPRAPEELREPVVRALYERYETTRHAAIALTEPGPMRAFVDRVYDQLETSGAAQAMQVAVASTDSSELVSLDASVAKSVKFRDRIAPIASYFDTFDRGAQQRQLKDAVQSGLSRFFPSDVMTFSDTDGDTHARIVIEAVIRPDWTDDGGFTLYHVVDDDHKEVPHTLLYPGVLFELGATLAVPGDHAPQHVRFTAQPAPHFTVDHEMGLATPLSDGMVYRAMADSAFADLQLQLVRALGGKQVAER
jgi:hypothetical protein